MPEPVCSRVRPIPMIRILAACSLAMVVLVGCGSAEQGSGDAAADAESAAPSASPNSLAASCDQSEDGFVITRNLANFDVDGDGNRDRVGLVEPTRAGCPPLVAVDDVAGSVGPGVSTQIPAGEPPVRFAFGAVVPGHQGALVVTSQIHPRGGFQLRLFALENGELAELKVDGHPLIPFVALDVQEHPLSVDCADGGVVITEAVAHKPAGVAFAWDVKRTTYAVNGNQVAAGSTVEVADNVLPNQLDKDYPDLVKHRVFRSCRAS